MKQSLEGIGQETVAKFQPLFDDMSARLTFGQPLYFVATYSRDKKPESDYRGFVLRHMAIYDGNSDRPFRFKLKQRVILNLWDYEREESNELPGVPSWSVSGIRGYPENNIHIGNLLEFASGGKDIKDKLLPGLEADRALVASRLAYLISCAQSQRNQGIAEAMQAHLRVVDARYMHLKNGLMQL